MKRDPSSFVGPGAPRQSTPRTLPRTWCSRGKTSLWEQVSHVIMSTMLVAFVSGVVLGTQQTGLSGGGVATGSFAQETVDLAMAGSAGWVQNLLFAKTNTAILNQPILGYIWMPYRYSAYAGAYVAAAASLYAEHVMAIAKT